MEHQLGTEDKERRAVRTPSPLDNIDRPMYVDCGADFTLVMTTDYVVKAFGGNSNGQVRNHHKHICQMNYCFLKTNNFFFVSLVWSRFGSLHR